MVPSIFTSSSENGKWKFKFVTFVSPRTLSKLGHNLRRLGLDYDFLSYMHFRILRKNNFTLYYNPSKLHILDLIRVTHKYLNLSTFCILCQSTHPPTFVSNSEPHHRLMFKFRCLLLLFSNLLLFRMQIFRKTSV
jgi:hypothetical protein